MEYQSDEVYDDDRQDKACDTSASNNKNVTTTNSRIKNILVGDQELSKDIVRLSSLMFMVAALVLGLLNYGQQNLPWASQYISYRPSMITTLYSLFLVLPLYVRGVLKWHGNTIFSILSLTLNIMVTAVLISMLLGGKTTIEYDILGNLSIDLWMQNSSGMALMIAIILSWLGMRVVAGLAWILVFFFAVVNVSIADHALGIWGSLFLIFGFIGIVLQNNMTPSIIYSELKLEFSGHGSEIKKDITETKKLGGRLAKTAAKRVI